MTPWIWQPATAMADGVATGQISALALTERRVQRLLRLAASGRVWPRRPIRPMD